MILIRLCKILMSLIAIVPGLNCQETLDAIVIKGSTAHLWCNFPDPDLRGHFPVRRVTYSPRFRPSTVQDQAIWAVPQDPSNETNRRFRSMYSFNDLSLNLTRVQYQDAGSYSCVDEDSRIILTHNVIVIGDAITLEKSYEIYDTDQVDDQYYLVPGDVPIYLICSMEVSPTPWENHHPVLSLDGGNLSTYRRYRHTISYTFVTNIAVTKEYTCSAIFPGYDLSPLRPSKVFIVVDDVQSSASYQRHVTKYAANRGKALILSCVSRYNSNDNWKWYKGRDFDSHDIVLPIVDCHLRREDRCTNLSTTSYLQDYSTRLYSLLIFPSLDYSSSGKYSCIDSLSTMEKLFEVIVLDNHLPEVMVDGRPAIQNSTIEFRKNQWTYISCSLPFFISSGLDSGVKLILEDANLHNVSRDGFIYTYRVLMLRSKKLICHVQLSDGFLFYGRRTNFTFFASVLYCPDNLRITGNISRNTIQKGGIINCVASAEPPVNVTWDSRSTSVNHFLSGPNFASLMVQNGDDYRCKTERAVHPILGICHVQYATIRIDQVLNVPRSRAVKIGAIRGQSLTFKCNSHHLGNTNWKWFKNWNLQTSSLNLPIVDCFFNYYQECTNVSTYDLARDYSTALLTQLTFTNVTQFHNGNYTCVDSLRSVEKTYELKVLECPSSMTISKLNWERPYGQGKELLCSVTADPPTNVTWSFRNQSQISISGWNSARMPIFQRGVYECAVELIHDRVMGSCGSLFSRVQVEDSQDHHDIEDRK